MDLTAGKRHGASWLPGLFQADARRRACRPARKPGDAGGEIACPLHFRLQTAWPQLRFWPPDAILDAVNRLQDAELAVKTGAADDETQCAQTLLGICIRGRA